MNRKRRNLNSKSDKVLQIRPAKKNKQELKVQFYSFYCENSKSFYFFSIRAFKKDLEIAYFHKFLGFSKTLEMIFTPNSEFIQVGINVSKSQNQIF